MLICVIDRLIEDDEHETQNQKELQIRSTTFNFTQFNLKFVNN